MPYYSWHMEADRIPAALARIEAATRRIERAASGIAGDPQLQARHERLRAEAGAVLADLDELIGALDG